MAGHIISVIGGKGGVGKSQIAANLALAWAAETRQKALLLDFDQKACGDQNIITGLRSKKTVKDLADFTGAVDPRTLALFTSDHKGGISYIGMPTEPVAAGQINEEALGKALKAMTNIHPVTVVDAGSELNPLAVKALEHSTLILLVVTPDLLSVNQGKRMYGDLMTMLFPKDMVQIVVNQFVNGHPVSPDVIGKQLGKAVFGIVPRDDQNCTAALTRSTPVVVAAKNAPFAAGVTDLCRKIIQKNVLPTLARLARPTEAKKPTAPGADPGVEEKKAKDAWTELKARIHRSLVEEMDLKKQDDNDPRARIILREQTKKMIVDLLGKEDTRAVLQGRDDMNRIVKEILDEALGLGPLEDMLADKSISEIMVVGPKKIYYEQGGKVKKSEITFTNDQQVRNVIERIVAPIGRRIDEKTPYVDARLQDGSRVHAIIPPCSIDGCCITIRKFPDKRLTYKDLVKFGSMTEEMADFMRISVEAHRNIVVSGGTGSGKTTLINMLGGFIQSNERIITCEDSAELNFPQDHVVRLETRPPSLEGDGEIDIRCLVKQTLRMRPDRIVVGECRGGETLDMLQAMNTGHDGSMTTVHSNTPRDSMGRLETLVQYSGASLTQRAIREMIASAVHLVIQQSRLDDGTRKIMNITEVGGIQGEIITLQDVFMYKQEGIGRDGKIQGKFMATGFIPKFIEVLERKGYKVPRGLFINK